MISSESLVATLCVVALSSTSFAQKTADDVVPFSNDKDPATSRPDQHDGLAAPAIIVKVRPGVQPVTRPDGSFTFSRTDGLKSQDRFGPSTISVLSNWDVRAVRPTTRFTPANAARAGQLGLDRYYTIELGPGSNSAALASILSRLGGTFESAEIDATGSLSATDPDDPDFSLQYGLHNTGQIVAGNPGLEDADIDAQTAWDLTTGSTGIVIAVLDAGVSHSHPELSSKLLAGYNFIDDNTDTDDDFNSHGTHVAGIATAAGNNGLGMSGVAWNSMLLPVKVVNRFGFSSQSVVGEGLIYAADNGARVAIASLGFSSGSSFLRDAVIYAYGEGVVMCCSTGNTPGFSITFPARYQQTIAVGATNNRDEIANFTTTGPQMTVVAPGVDIYSTWDSTGLGPGTDTYAFRSGTSQANPFVGGLAALILSVNPSLTPAQVRGYIENSADDLGPPGEDDVFGHGRINAGRAVWTVHRDLTDFDPTQGARDCIGDFNNDSNLNTADFVAYLVAYGNDRPSADLVSPFGTVDTSDFLYFINAYRDACRTPIVSNGGP